jgi:hypothetical protein
MVRTELNPSTNRAAHSNEATSFTLTLLLSISLYLFYTVRDKISVFVLLRCNKGVQTFTPEVSSFLVLLLLSAGKDFDGT